MTAGDGDVPPQLQSLADRHGVATTYLDQRDQPRTVPVETVRAVLAAMGVDPAAADEAAPALPPSAAVPQQQPATLPVGPGAPSVLRLTCEDGAVAEVAVNGGRAQLPGLPAGYHLLDSGEGDPGCVLVAAPPRCPVPSQRQWGWMVQLYALRSRDSWGLGDLGDLTALATHSAAQLGAGFVLVNPLHANSPVRPQEPSPYYPSSRRFVDPLYLRVTDLPEWHRADAPTRERIAALAGEAQRSNTADVIDRDAVHRRKSEAFTLLFAAADPRGDEEFERFCRAHAPALTDFATFCALAERHGLPFDRWPADLRHPRARGIAGAQHALAERIAYHSWLQWRCHQQLSAAQRAAAGAGMATGIIHDLAVGVSPHGVDAWALQDDLGTSVTVGAPPDAINQLGQDWQQRPLLPQALRRTAFAPFRDMLLASLPVAGGLRMDHVMGLFRLFWIPDGAEPRDGTYVRYPAEELLAVLRLEACRAGSIVIGEDLGTVEPGVQERLAQSGVLSSRVLYFEQDSDGRPKPPGAYPQLAFASVNTHDLPTAAGWWTGQMLREQVARGLLPPDSDPQQEERRLAGERARLRALLRAEGLVGDDPAPEELVLAMHAFLGRTPAVLVAAAVADAVGDLRQPNLPGTRDEYPNWRRPVARPGPEGARPVLLEDLLEAPGTAAIAAALRDPPQR